MAKNILYATLGEEQVRGTKEAATVGYVPLLGSSIPKMEFDDRRRKEFRGADAVKGDGAVVRLSRRWSGTVETPFFTEADSAGRIGGRLLKHFFGKAAPVENGGTGPDTHTLF